MKEEYTLTVYTEDQIGLMNKIAIMFLRKKIGFKSLNISSCEIANMYRFTIVVNETSEIVQNLTLQIEKIIDVFKCYCNNNEEILTVQTVLYKVSTKVLMTAENFDVILKKYSAKFASVKKKYTFIEFTGQENEVDCLTQALQKFELVEFVKSATVSLIKSSEGFEKELAELEELAITVS